MVKARYDIREKMTKIWKSQPKEVLQSWIDAILTEASDELSLWETNFIISVNEQVKYKELTQRQEEILEKIYAEKTK